MATAVLQTPRVTLDSPLRFLKGVGEARASLFASAGLHRVGDLLLFFPFRYEDRRRPTAIRDVHRATGPVTLRGRILSATARVSPIRRLDIFQAVLDDGTGTILLIWFNQHWLSEQISRGMRLVIYGEPRINSHGKLQIENPEFERIPAGGEIPDEGSIVPVYSSVSGIPPRVMRRIVQQSLEAVASIDDPLPVELRQRLEVIDLPTAILQRHHPPDLDDDLLQGRSPAHRRLILQEFLAFQLSLRARRADEEQTAKPRQIEIDDRLRERVRKVLPFRLTEAQKRVLREIADDLRSPRPMYRLLQGDVGSGKTIIALIAATIEMANGHQAAFLAPTEILAEQHFQRISQLLEGSGVRVAKLIGSTAPKTRERLLRELGAGRIDLLVGTHALLEDSVSFPSLGLAIVDEQHRFGVDQRRKLFSKSNLCDILVMTATPIPRSMAIALYGDLDLSVIDELPSGRRPITTVVRGTARIEKIYRFMDEQFEQGAQAYVVFPLIDESENLPAKALRPGFDAISTAFPGRRVEMLHGQMSSGEKENIMQRFKNREVDLLVTTTIIEVGIDVPNASVMLIMDAERFGFSQLHQLRGRIGRGARKSYCVLIRDERCREEAKQRLQTFAATKDGFEVAELDLERRGAGDFFGTRQSGVARFRFGDLRRDHRLMELARDTAVEVIRSTGARAAMELAEACGGRDEPVAPERD